MVNEISNMTQSVNSRAVEVTTARNHVNPTTKIIQNKSPERTETPADAVKNQEKASQPKREDVESAVKNINDFVQKISRSLQFSIDDESGVTVVRVIDKNTDELIRQIPSEEVMNLRKRLNEVQTLIFEKETNGLLFKDSV